MIKNFLNGQDNEMKKRLTFKHGNNHVVAFPHERGSIQQVSECRDNQRSISREIIISF